MVRLVNTWLTARSRRQPRRWYDPVFPFLGRLVHYNFVLLATQWLLYALQLPTNYQAITSKFIAIATAIINCVMLIQMVHATEAVMIARSQSRLRDPYKFRNVQTRLRILRQLSVFLVLIFSAAAVLMNIDAVRQIGTGLLASAGVAGVIVGFAAQKSLTTIIAGLQVAVTNPMKIDDVVFVESEYGTIEEITLTYVVVKLWDLRRMVLPITIFSKNRSKIGRGAAPTC